MQPAVPNKGHSLQHKRAALSYLHSQAQKQPKCTGMLRVLVCSSAHSTSLGAHHWRTATTIKNCDAVHIRDAPHRWPCHTRRVTQAHQVKQCHAQHTARTRHTTSSSWRSQRCCRSSATPATHILQLLVVPLLPRLRPPPHTACPSSSLPAPPLKSPQSPRPACPACLPGSHWA
jgi:hypothetical protein